MEAVRKDRLRGVLSFEASCLMTRNQLVAARKMGFIPVMAGGAEGPAATIEEMEGRISQIVARLQELDGNAATRGGVLDDEEKAEWNRISLELENTEDALKETRSRKQWLDNLQEREDTREAGAHFGVQSPRAALQTQDIWDLTTIRRNYDRPHEQVREASDRAKRAIESFVFPHPDVQRGVVSNARVREHLTNLLATAETEHGELSRHILKTGSPLYARAFAKAVQQRPMTGEEERALAEATGSAGGYAVPITLDPTLIPVSNGVVNPIRALARVETIVGQEYRGLTVGAVTASYAAEGTEAADNAPSLAQPDVFAERAQAFIPYSIELGMDWSGLAAGMAQLLGDAKDTLEGTKFTLGAGHGSNEPSGLITGATDTVLTAGSSAFAVADLYTLEEALPPRFRPLAQFFGNRHAYNLIRQFGASANQNLWQSIANPATGPLGLGLDNRPFGGGGNLGQKLLGYGANEVSDMTTAITSGSAILCLGDPRYYLIVDRIGMTVELIPHLFGTNRRPTGQRGFYAVWRNTGTVVDPNAFRCLLAR